MADTDLVTVLRHIHRLAGSPAAGEPGDTQLVHRLATGLGGPAGAFPLAQAARRGMLLDKLKTCLLLTLAAVALVTIGTGGLALQATPKALQQVNDQAQSPPAVGNVAATEPPADKPRTDSFGDPLPAGALLRLGTLRHRLLNQYFLHTEYLLDGKTALTANFEEVRWVDIASGRLLKSWPLPKGSKVAGLEQGITVAGFSPDGRLVLLGDDKGVQLWDLTSRKWLWTFQDTRERGARISARFAADGKVVAVKYSGTHYTPGFLRVLDVPSGWGLWMQTALGTGESISDIGFLPDGKSMLFEERDRDTRTTKLVQRERDSGRIMRSFEILRGEGGYCQLSPDGNTVFCATTGKAIRTWDVATGRELSSLIVPAAEKLIHPFDLAGRCCGISRDGKIILTGGYPNRFVLIWDWPAAKQRGKIDLGAGKSPWYLCVSADGKRAELSFRGEDALRFFDLETGKEIAGPKEAHRSAVLGLAIAPDGKVVTAGTDNTLRVWDLRSGRQLHEYQTHEFVGFTALGTTLGLSGDGRLIATAMRNPSNVLIHERDTGRLLQRIDTGATYIMSVAFAPQQRLLAISGNKDDKQKDYPSFLALWDIDRARERWRLEERLLAPAFSPDGRLVAVVPNTHPPDGIEQVRLLETETGRKRQSIPGKSMSMPHELAFSPDGRMLAARNWKMAIVWELATGKERWRSAPAMESPFHSRAFQFSPDGRWLALGENRFVQLYDVLRGRQVHSFAGHDQCVMQLAFGPDGRTLASASSDTTVLIWDMASWLASQRKHSAAPNAIALEAAWKGLASDNAEAAFTAVRLLVEAGPAGIPLLRERIRPAEGPDPKRLERLLADLASDRFAERERAQTELERLGNSAEEALKRFLKEDISLEARRRAEALWARLQGPITDVNRLQQLRGLEVLEHIASPAARDILQVLAKGAPDARLTREAREALQRLAKRHGTRP